MRAFVLAFFVGGLLIQGGFPVGAGPLCLMAQTVAAQERQLPNGEWCQRSVAKMTKQAHACECHKADCTDPDPDHLPAHVDAMCLSYCHVNDCRCTKMDCP